MKCNIFFEQKTYTPSLHLVNYLELIEKNPLINLHERLDLTSQLFKYPVTYYPEDLELYYD